MVDLVDMPAAIVADVGLPNVVASLVKTEGAGFFAFPMQQEMLLLSVP